MNEENIDPDYRLDNDAAIRIIDQFATLKEREDRIRQKAAEMVGDIVNERCRLTLLHGDRLETWVRSKLVGKRRSIKTLAGTAGFRTSPERIVIHDAAGAVAWARTNCPAAISERVDSAALHVSDFDEVDTETGEVVNSLPSELFEIVMPIETFYVAGLKSRTDPGED